MASIMHAKQLLLSKAVILLTSFCSRFSCTQLLSVVLPSKEAIKSWSFNSIGCVFCDEHYCGEVSRTFASRTFILDSLQPSKHYFHSYHTSLYPTIILVNSSHFSFTSPNSFSTANWKLLIWAGFLDSLQPSKHYFHSYHTSLYPTIILVNSSHFSFTSPNSFSTANWKLLIWAGFLDSLQPSKHYFHSYHTSLYPTIILVNSSQFSFTSPNSFSTANWKLLIWAGFLDSLQPSKHYFHSYHTSLYPTIILVNSSHFSFTSPNSFSTANWKLLIWAEFLDSLQPSKHYFHSYHTSLYPTIILVNSSQFSFTSPNSFSTANWKLLIWAGFLDSLQPSKHYFQSYHTSLYPTIILVNSSQFSFTSPNSFSTAIWKLLIWAGFLDRVYNQANNISTLTTQKRPLPNHHLVKIIQ